MEFFTLLTILPLLFGSSTAIAPAKLPKDGYVSGYLGGLPEPPKGDWLSVTFRHFSGIETGGAASNL